MIGCTPKTEHVRKQAGAGKKTGSVWESRQKTKSIPGFYLQPKLEDIATETDLSAVSKMFGFDVKLPKSPLAAAAGSPKVYVEHNFDSFLEAATASPRPAEPNAQGVAAIIEYPNGLQIYLQIRHPQDPTVKNYSERVIRNNNNFQQLAARGAAGGSMSRLTKIGGFEAKESDAGWIAFADPAIEKPTPERRLQQPAVIVWYDPENWVEYGIKAPINAPMPEFRAIANSIYQ